MTKKSDPLDSHFQIEGSNYDDEYDDEIEIPSESEKQNLELVIDLALRQYKTNSDDMEMLEPKNRLKAQELNRDFLNIVKDARYKLERIRIEQEKLRRSAGKNKPAPNDSGGESSGEEPKEEKTVSRSELLKRVK